MEKANLRCRQCLLREMEDKEILRSVQACIERLPPYQRVDEDCYEQRLAICRNCDKLQGGTCMLCGCYVELRAASGRQYCPASPRKWDRKVRTRRMIESGGTQMAENRKQSVMKLHIRLREDQIRSVKSREEEILMIPFEGTAEGELFSGSIGPGGTDIQRVSGEGHRSLCARYMLEGTDRAGKKCRIFVENRAEIDPGGKESFRTEPVFRTDSSELESYFAAHRLYGVMESGDEGLQLLFYESEEQESCLTEQKEGRE